MKIINIDEQKNINKKKVLITSIIVAIICIVIILFIIYSSSSSFREVVDKYVLMKNIVEDSTPSITLDENETNNIFAYDKYISILSKNTLKNYNSSGKEEGNLTIEISSPITATSGKYLLIAEKDAQKIYLISGNQIIWQKELEGNIDRISVNKNGYVAVILSGTINKSVIQTFDSTGVELFKTYLSRTIAMDVDISWDNQYLAFAEINTSGTTVKSIIKIVSIQKAKTTPAESIIYTYSDTEGNLITNIKYQEGNRLICMCDSGVYIVQNEKYNELIKLIENDQKITFGGIELSNRVYRVIEKSSLLNTQTTVEIVNVSNNKTSVYNLEGVAKEIYSYNDTISVNLGSEVHFISTNGWLIKKYISSQEIRTIVMCNNFAGIVYRNKIEIVNF